MAEFVAAQASVLIVPTLGKGANSFHQKLKEQLQTVRESVDVKIKADTAAMVAEVQATKEMLERDPINIRVETDNNGIKELVKSVTEVRHKYEDLKGDFRRGLTLNLKVVGLSALSQLGPMLASLNTSIVQLSQSSLLLPGIMSGVASSVGAAVVGSRGLTDAFKAQSDASKNVAEAGKQQRDANRAIRDSTRDLNNAIRDAKRNIEDLNAQLRDAPLDEAEAMLNLQEAQYEASQKWGKTAFQQQRDALGLAKAESQLAETRRRNVRLGQDVAEANAKGVNGNDAVVAAQERLTKALEDLAMQTGPIRALNDAMAKLSPNARDFVDQVSSLKGAWDGLRSTVQDRLFDGLGASVQTLAGQDLPILERGLAGIAGAINGNLKTAMSQLATDENKGFLGRIFGNTEEAQNRFSTALKPLLDSFMQLSAVGSDYLPRLSNAFGDVLNRFDGFIERADADGSLDKWINNGLDAMTQLGNSLINVGSIMNTISEAFTGTGGKGLLELLETGTKRLADFLKGAEGQQKLKQFFLDARTELNNWKPLLSQLPGLIKNVATAGQQWANLVLPFLTSAASLLKEHPGLVTAIFTAYMTWRTISPIIGTINLLLSSETGMVGAAKKAGRAVGKGEGLTGKLGVLAGMVGQGGVVMTGLSLVAGFLINEWVTAQNEAAEAVSYHASMISRLKGEMDGLTGSLTTQGLQGKLDAARQWTDIHQTDGKPKDLVAAANSFGVDLPTFMGALTPTNQAARNAVTGKARQTVLDDLNKQGLETVLGKDALNALNLYNQNAAPDKKITNDVLADIATGVNPESKKLFEDAKKSNLIHFNESDLLYGYNKPWGFIPGTDPSGKGLSPVARDAANVSGFVLNDTGNALQVGSDIRSTNEALYGKAVLTPAGQQMFGQFGSPQASFENGSKDAAVRVDTTLQNLPPQFVKDVESNGGHFEELPDGVIIHMRKDRAAQYVTAGSYAGGGFLSGPGTGRSDSMLARVSNGEFITRAASVAKYGRGLFDALNSGTLDPSMLPRFDSGGLVDIFLPGGGTAAPPPTGSANPVDLARGLPRGPAVQSAPANRFDPSPLPTDLLPKPVIPMPDLANPGLYDPATGKYGAAPASAVQQPLKPGVDGDKGETSGPNVPPTDPRSPGYKQPNHGLGGSPGPGNGTPHLTGPGGTPVSPGAASALPSNGGIPGLTPSATDPLGLSGLPKEIQPVTILEQIGEILLSAVLGFFGLDPTYFNIGKRIFTGIKGDKPNEANPGVQSILDGYKNPLADGQNPYVGTSIYDASFDPASQRASNMAELMRGKPYTWGGSSLDGTDCSGLVMYVVDAYEGKEFSGRTGGTGGFASSLPAKGGVIISDPSQAPPGTLRVGWNASHTAGTLPDGRNFESSTFGKPIAVGAGASGYNDPQFTNWAYFPAPGYANGGFLSGAGTGRSDSMLARVSNGEFITRASSVAKYGRSLFDALNAGTVDPGMLPGFADGTPPIPGLPVPQPQTPQQAGPLPDPNGQDAQAAQQVTDTAASALDGVAGAMNGVNMGSSGAIPGADAPDGAQQGKDPRSILGAAPTNTDHNNPALSKGIQGAFSTVGSLASMAASAAMSAGTMGAGAAGASGAAGSGIQAGAQIAGQVATGALNILSSLLVGSAPGSTGTTQSAYGAPVLPQGPPQSSGGGPAVVNNYGDIHTANYDEFYKGQQRREAQQQAPILPVR
uniref:Tape measure protein (gp16) n=1 Tax=Mycolicibacterium smegmatis (strain ATCC 700084 / mc(2)155) TaxID=246196 RepID=UPI003D3C3550